MLIGNGNIGDELNGLVLDRVKSDHARRKVDFGDFEKSPMLTRVMTTGGRSRGGVVVGHVPSFAVSGCPPKILRKKGKKVAPIYV